MPYLDEETGGFVENKDSISQQRGTLFEIVAADRTIDLHIKLEAKNKKDNVVVWETIDSIIIQIRYLKNYFKNLEKLPTFCEKSVETPPKNSLTKEFAFIKA